MAKIATEARQVCPELIEAIKVLDRLAYSRNYAEVFEDLVNWLVWQYLYPPDDKGKPPLSKYKEEEKELFKEILKIVMGEVKSRVGLWTRDHHSTHIQDHSKASWFDPLGRMYEAIVSKYKSSRLGQYFTPEHVVDLMTQLTNPVQDKELIKILDPACGSGRMGLSAATYAMAHSCPSWVSMNDLDPICTKMTAINMCLNGVVGEVTCMNGLDIEGTSYRFGYRIIPALSVYPTDMWEFYRMVILMKTGQDIRKQYVLVPIAYEETYLKQVNDQYLKELEERMKIQEQEEREKAVKDMQDQIKARMGGTLFENDQTQIINVTHNLSEQLKKKKKTNQKKTKPKGNDQPTLF